MGTAQMLPWWAHITEGGRKKGKQKKAEKNANRMFQIMAGLSTGAKNFVSEEDKAWLNNELQSNSQTLMETLMERRELAAKDLVDDRMESEHNENSDHSLAATQKKNFMSRTSGNYYNMDIYDKLVNAMQKNNSNTKYADADKYFQENQRKNGIKDSSVLIAKLFSNSDAYMSNADQQTKDAMRRGYIQRGAYIYNNFNSIVKNSNSTGIYDSYLEQNGDREAPHQKAPELRPYEINMDKARKKGTKYNPTGAEDLREFKVAGTYSMNGTEYGINCILL